MNSMGKSDDELRVGISQSRHGSHEYLLNCVVRFIGSQPTAYSDARKLRNEILQRDRCKTIFRMCCISYFYSVTLHYEKANEYQIPLRHLIRGAGDQADQDCAD